MSEPVAPQTVSYVQVDKMLLSMRSSGYDTPAAIGEPIDNAVQANAKMISVRLLDVETTTRRGRSARIVEKIAVADDGDGMKPDVLHRCLVLGYSTRFDSRNGLGRFGVGATLAALSQAKRIDVFSRTNGEDPWLHVSLDLEEIGNGKTIIDPPKPDDIPPAFKDMVSSGAGTLVVWSKCDRIAEGDQGTVRDVVEIKDQLRVWLGRTYRYFLAAGLKMLLNDEPIEPHDPLFLLDIPSFPTDPKAEVLAEDYIDWPLPNNEGRTSRIQVRLTLLPAEWRKERGEGGSGFAKTRNIDDNEGLSIVRANREVFWGNLAKFYPSDKIGRESQVRIDRWFGLEIAFEPDLDECFGVRNVKRGVEPFESLRKALRQKLGPWVTTARDRIRQTYQITDSRKKHENRLHANAERAGAAFSKTAPPNAAGADITDDKRNEIIEDIATHILKAINTPNENLVKELKEEVAALPFKIVDEEWPGREFVAIEHLGPNTIIRLNNAHPFFTRVYSRIVAASGRLGDGTEISKDELVALTGLVQDALDILLIAYAKAEGMSPDASEKYGDLRTEWGQYLYSLIQNHLSRE